MNDVWKNEKQTIIEGFFGKYNVSLTFFSRNSIEYPSEIQNFRLRRAKFPPEIFIEKYLGNFILGPARTRGVQNTFINICALSCVLEARKYNHASD